MLSFEHNSMCDTEFSNSHEIETIWLCFRLILRTILRLCRIFMQATTLFVCQKYTCVSMCVCHLVRNSNHPSLNIVNEKKRKTDVKYSSLVDAFYELYGIFGRISSVRSSSIDTFDVEMVLPFRSTGIHQRLDVANL